LDQAEARSPDGRLLVRWEIDHGRMSHEICTPTIVDLAMGRTLLAIRQHGVDGHPQWRPGGFSLGLRNYYYPQLSVKLTAEVEQGWFRFDDDEKTHPLDPAQRPRRCGNEAADALGRESGEPPMVAAGPPRRVARHPCRHGHGRRGLFHAALMRKRATQTSL
jgi:hypothetical protein